jgi:hypothetical protein
LRTEVRDRRTFRRIDFGKAESKPESRAKLKESKAKFKWKLGQQIMLDILQNHLEDRE